MGNEANVKTGKSTNSNLKVPPIKIVLSSNQNSAVVNVCSQQQGDNQSDPDAKSDTGGHTSERDVSNVADVKETSTKAQRKRSRGSPDDVDTNSSRYNEFYSSSSSSTASDRSMSTSPASESESAASNSTIISDNQHVTKTKSDIKESSNVSVKREKESRVESRVATTAVESKPSSSKRSQETPAESNHNEPTNSCTKEQVNSNQRITRSSQRAAQQNRAEFNGDINIDDPNISENQDKPNETSRKTKRRRGEPQDVEQDGSQANSQPVVLMANICPADYQLPSQNSFELYRDIRKRPYKKMLQLSHVQPRVPQGFKDYLINGGPYLLDGNKLGVGVNGQRMANSCDSRYSRDARCSSSRTRMPVKLSNLRIPSYNSSKQRHYNYNIPKPLDAPTKLPIGSSLHDLFMDQEKARHQMRMQHLKERERSILATEQEILRAYNKIAIADNKQEFHLSACTYFYHQERYHYLDERTESEKIEDSKGNTHCQDSSSLCKDGDDAASAANEASKSSTKVVVTNDSSDSSAGGTANNLCAKDVDTSMDCNDDNKNDKPNPDEEKATRNSRSDGGAGVATAKANGSTEFQSERVKDTRSAVKEDKSDGQKEDSSESKSVELDNQETKCENAFDLSNNEFKSLNKKVFLDHLQEIDDKWAKVRKEMFTRHKNESDSLYAVQTLDWEWKAKEIGACDVRVSLKIEPDLVPKVEVSKLDY